MKKLNIVFLGTPEFSVPTLKALANNPLVNIQYVVSMPDRPAGRGQKMASPPVAQFAKDFHIPLFQTENINKEDQFLQNLKDIDLFVVLAFAQFLNSKVLSKPKLGCFNIHTSLLPKYRGAAPIQYALLNGDETTGVSIQKMVKKMDAGDLVYSKEVKIFPEDNYEKLSERLKILAAEGINEFLNNFVSNKITFISQDETKVTFAPSFTKEDGHLHFDEKNDFEILNQIRAFTPWPSAFCFLNGKRLKITSAKKVSSKKLKAGEVEITASDLMVGCKNGTLSILEAQLEGKKPCSGQELINGIKSRNEKIILS